MSYEFRDGYIWIEDDYKLRLVFNRKAGEVGLLLYLLYPKKILTFLCRHAGRKTYCFLLALI